MTRLYLPLVAQRPGPPVQPEAERMAALFVESDWQRRANPRPHELLMQAAQAKAVDMLTHRYFGHTMHDGTSANANVRATGYPLPDWYGEGANNVESIILNIWPPEKMFEAWATSPTHWRHIAGLHPFFREQTCFGVGYVEGPDDAGKYGVIITAPCPLGE